VRLPKGTRLAQTGDALSEQLRAMRSWTERQWQVIELFINELQHANQQRALWRSLIAQEVAADPLLLSLIRLCGVRDLVAFALGAIIGDVHRFGDPKKLVKYVGLNPAFDDSGEHKWEGGIGGHGRKDLRGLLVESAHAVLRSQHPLARWGKKLLARKGELKLVVAAIARKLTVAVWYLMMGRWTTLEEIDNQLTIKVGKITSNVGINGLKSLAKTRKQLREEMFLTLKAGRIYEMDFSH
jgi:hypothetical protein